MKELTKNAETSPEATGGYAPKKPSASVKLSSIEDLKEWVWGLLRKAAKEPDPKKRFAILEEARDHARRVRWHGWAGPRWATVFAAVSMGGAAAMLYLWLFPRTEWRVLEQTDRDGYEFELQRVVNGHPLLPELRRFCPYELRPRFEIGMTLSELTYEERGNCISIQADDLGYKIKRGKDHKPLLAGNCYSPGDEIPNVCFGPPQFDLKGEK